MTGPTTPLPTNRLSDPPDASNLLTIELVTEPSVIGRCPIAEDSVWPSQVAHHVRVRTLDHGTHLSEPLFADLILKLFRVSSSHRSSINPFYRVYETRRDGSRRRIHPDPDAHFDLFVAIPLCHSSLGRMMAMGSVGKGAVSLVLFSRRHYITPTFAPSSTHLANLHRLSSDQYHDPTFEFLSSDLLRRSRRHSISKRQTDPDNKTCGE